MRIVQKVTLQSPVIASPAGGGTTRSRGYPDDDGIAASAARSASGLLAMTSTFMVRGAPTAHEDCEETRRRRGDEAIRVFLLLSRGGSFLLASEVRARPAGGRPLRRSHNALPPRAIRNLADHLPGPAAPWRPHDPRHACFLQPRLEGLPYAAAQDVGAGRLRRECGRRRRRFGSVQLRQGWARIEVRR